MPGFAGRGYTPHFLFETSKRKCAVHGGKEKMLGGSTWHPCVKLIRNTGVVVAGAVQTCRPVPGALYPFGTEMVLPRIWGFRLAFGVLDARSVPLAPRLSPPKSRRFAAVGSDTRLRAQPLRYALPLPCPRGGNPKGRGRSPSPLCRFNGVRGKQAKRRQWRMKRACFEEAARLAAPKRGRKSQCCDGVEIEIPPGFTSAQRNRPRLTGRLMPGLFGGCGGHFSFQKRNVPPLPVPLVRGTKKGQPCG